MQVTFDTNVWNRVVFPDRWQDNPNHNALVKINEALHTGQIQGFICESFGTVEAIRKRDRAKFYADKKPIIEVTSNRGPGLVCMAIKIETDHSLHPGLGEHFDEELDAALAVGMKLLPTPYMNNPLPDRFRNDPSIYAPEVFETSDYNERFGSIVGAINARGVGEGKLLALAKQIAEGFGDLRSAGVGDRELIHQVYAASSKKDKEDIEKAFAEDADGDVVAAHIALGNDYLCSDDRGKSATGASVFDKDNRAWLKATYSTVILSAKQLVEALESSG